jgi:uncharacterized protein
VLRGVSTQAHAGRIAIPACEGRGVRVSAGRTLRVVDVEGGQVGDLFAFAAEDSGEYLSGSHTRAATSRLFPQVGECFVSNRRRPLLELVADDSPGVHDMLIAACDPARYPALGSTARTPPARRTCAACWQRAACRRRACPSRSTSS